MLYIVKHQALIMSKCKNIFLNTQYIAILQENVGQFTIYFIKVTSLQFGRVTHTIFSVKTYMFLFLTFFLVINFFVQ